MKDADTFWRRASRNKGAAPIKGQCAHVCPNGKLCFCAVWSEHGTLCYQHARAGKKRATSRWAPYGRCPRCKAQPGKPCVTHSGNPTFCHVGRAIVPSKRLRVDRYGPVPARLVEVSGGDRQVTVAFVMPADEARKLVPALFEWGELALSVATLEPLDREGT